MYNSAMGIDVLKAELAALIIFVSLLLPFSINAGAGGSNTLVINEVMYNPEGNEVDGEWVELYNVGDDVNVKNWTLTDRDGATFEFPELIVPSHGFVLIHISTGNITYQPNTIILYMNRTWSMLNNAGDDLLLVDSQGTAIDYINYGSGSAIDYPISPLTWAGTNKTVSEGLSYALTPDGQDLDSDVNWAEALPSPGTYNSVDEVHEVLITEVYYHAHRDNEYITIHNPSDELLDLTSWSLGDLEGAIYFPQDSVLSAGANITIAENSTAYHEDTLFIADYQFKSGNATPMIVGGIFKLKNDGDEVILRNRASRVIDALCYGASSYSDDGWMGSSTDLLAKGTIAKRHFSGDRYLDTNTSDDWESLREYGIGQSSFRLKTFHGHSSIVAFTSPDSSYKVITDAIGSARTSIRISLYKLTNWHLAQHLLDALERGVEVKILLEGATVQGVEDDEKYIMKAVSEKGGEIVLMIHNTSADIYERYRYLHAKFVVIDNELSIVTSENWGSTGIPKDNSYGNRGWGISVKNVALADELLEILFEDWNPSRRDIARYSSENYPVPPGYSHSSLIASGAYEPQFEPLETSGYYSITPVLSPDTSLDEGAVLGLIREAQTSILIEQFYTVEEWTENRINPYLEEVIEAARRGVEVRVLLDDSEYNTEPDEIDNDDVVISLNNLANSEDLDLEAKLINSTSHGILKLHNKGMIVDKRKTLISSINWNYNSVTRNRELGIIVEDEGIAEYYTGVFLYDWKDDVRDPIAIGCDDTTIVVGEEVFFDGSTSYDASPLEFKWDFDGDGIVDSTVPMSSFLYNQVGLYTVKLNISDSSGNYNVSRCLVDVVSGDDPSNEGTGNSLMWVFYLILILTTFFLIYYARKLSRKGKNI